MNTLKSVLVLATVLGIFQGPVVGTALLVTHIATSNIYYT